MSVGEKKISELPEATSFTGAEWIVLNQGGTTKRILASLVAGGTGDPMLTQSLLANQANYVTLGLTSIKTFRIEYTAYRDTKIRTGLLKIVQGITAVLEIQSASYPDTDGEELGLSFTWDTDSGNVRLIVTCDNSDILATTFDYYLKTF